MTTATVGAAKITRIEESYGFFFEAKQFFPDWRDDIVGWNTKLDSGRWVPTFPNAKYVWSKTDFEHFSALDRDQPHAA